MGYYRAKQPQNKQRRVAGYTKSDGTRVASYLRAKVKSRKRRYVNA